MKKFLNNIILMVVSLIGIVVLIILMTMFWIMVTRNHSTSKNAVLAKNDIRFNSGVDYNITRS